MFMASSIQSVSMFLQCEGYTHLVMSRVTQKHRHIAKILQGKREQLVFVIWFILISISKKTKTKTD